MSDIHQAIRTERTLRMVLYLMAENAPNRLTAEQYRKISERAFNAFDSEVKEMME